MKRRVVPALCVFMLACSGGTGGSRATDAPGKSPEGDDARVVPEGLAIRALAGGNGVLSVTALTLQQGPGGIELYAALKNEGNVPACDAAFSVELFDQSEQSLAAGIGAVFTGRFYRLEDGSGTVAACAGPGDVTMTRVTDLPPDIAVDEVGYVVYRCPYFALDVVPIAGLTVGDLTSIARGAGTAYSGTLVNELDITVRNPSVTVFPLNRVGRPIGVVAGSSATSIAPGSKWAFETNPVDVPAFDYAAYPAGALAIK